MVGDYHLHRSDRNFVQARLAGVEVIINWFEGYRLANGLIDPTPYWNFVDWSPDWPWDNVMRRGGVPKVEGGSSILSLQYYGALKTASGLMRNFNEPATAAEYEKRAKEILSAVEKHCLDQNGYLYDTPTKANPSVQANILAMLYGVTPPQQVNHVIGEILGQNEEENLTGAATRYFQLFLGEALYANGRADVYDDMLDIWREQLPLYFSTWPEKPFPDTRSDCHAWSASPNYHLPSVLAGIRPVAPGFERVNISPATSLDQKYQTSVPTGNGALIEMSYVPKGAFTEIKLRLPAGTSGTLHWKGKDYKVKGGESKTFNLAK